MKHPDPFALPVIRADNLKTLESLFVTRAEFRRSVGHGLPQDELAAMWPDSSDVPVKEVFCLQVERALGLPPFCLSTQGGLAPHVSVLRDRLLVAGALLRFRFEPASS